MKYLVCLIVFAIICYAIWADQLLYGEHEMGGLNRQFIDHALGYDDNYRNDSVATRMLYHKIWNKSAASTLMVLQLTSTAHPVLRIPANAGEILVQKLVEQTITRMKTGETTNDN